MAKAKMSEEFMYPSITSPISHPSPDAFAAELLVYRHSVEDGYNLPEFFWRKDVECNNKYKKEFMDNIQCIRRLITLGIQPHFIIQCCIYSKIKYADYGYITAIVKKRWQTWKERVSQRLINQAEEMFMRQETAKELDISANDEYNNKEFSGTVGNKKKIRF